MGLEWNQEVLRFVEGGGAKSVLLVGCWLPKLHPEFASTSTIWIDDESTVVSPENALSSAQRRLDELTQRLQERGVGVWFVQQVPMQSWAVMKGYALHERLGVRLKPSIDRDEHLRRQAAISELLKPAIASGLRVVDPSEPFFRDGEAPLVHDGELCYKDGNHLTQYAVREFLPVALEPVFSEIAHHEAERREVATAIDRAVPDRTR